MATVYQLKYMGDNIENAALETIIIPWHRENPSEPSPRYRFGFRRLCSPCMNVECSFFGSCTVREHYDCTDTICVTDSWSMHKHVGAYPQDHFL
jgi:hypothetical protein